MIISKRFFEGRTQIEVADEIGISQAQVSRLEKNAINHIKRLYKWNCNKNTNIILSCIILVFFCEKKIH